MVSTDATSDTDEDLCDKCRIVWDVACRTGTRQGSRGFQRRLCYNPRPYYTMPEKVALSYARLTCVFELNWTVIEPISSCASDHHPAVAGALRGMKQSEGGRSSSAWGGGGGCLFQRDATADAPACNFSCTGASTTSDDCWVDDLTGGEDKGPPIRSPHIFACAICQPIQGTSFLLL